MIICHVYVSKTLKVYVVLFFFIIGGILSDAFTCTVYIGDGGG